MDWNEIKKGLVYRHPWELSRTRKVTSVLNKIISSGIQDQHKFIDVGAGDMFFDFNWKKLYPKSVCYAVDIGYGPNCHQKNESTSACLKFYSVDQIQDREFDFALMLDSLEYFDDEVEYLNQLKQYIKINGYLLLVVPAFSRLYSDHDRHAKLLRRYDFDELREIIEKVDGIEICYDQYFYFSLLLVRGFQKLFKIKIDPNEKLTTGWKYSEQHIISKMVVGILNIDFSLQTLLRKLGLRVPGLSILVLCKKTK